MNDVYGYVRVSSIEQNEDRQMIALKKIGISTGHIFMDKMWESQIRGSLAIDMPSRSETIVAAVVCLYRLNFLFRITVIPSIINATYP